jgi:hypothetical protein
MANSVWYFTTREGMDVGPFETREAAVIACDRLVELLRPITDFDEARMVTNDFIRLQLRR